MTENIIKIWKEKNIDHVNFNFSCGGDSMNDTDVQIYNKEGNNVEDKEIEDYFQEKTYDNVEFYVNSDGHYQGEFGVVTITLNEDKDGFDYSKSSSTEWSESSISEVGIELTENEAQFVSNYVLNINGGNGDCQTNYKKDFILTDEEEETQKELEEKICDFARSYAPDECGGELEDWHTFTTNEMVKDLKIVGNMLTLYITNSFSVIKDGD